MKMLHGSVLLKELHKVGQRLASQQAVQKAPKLSSAPVVQIDNGLTVVSSNPDGRVSRIVVLVNAGSRFETNSSRGLSHVIRAYAGSSSENSALLNAHLTAQLGGSIKMSATREHLLYSLTGGRGACERIFTDVLAPKLTSSEFISHEFNEMQISRIMQHQKTQAYSNVGVKLLDAAHEASFRGGLSHSIFAPDSMMDECLTEFLLEEFVAGGFTPNRMIISGMGVDHDKLCQLASAIPFSKTGASLSDNSEFISTEIRQNTYNSGSVNTALCFPGVSLDDQNTIAAAVLQQLVGPQTNIKYAGGSSRGLTSALVKASEGGFTTSVFNVNYSNNGLFGVTISSDAEDAASLLKAVNAQCKSYANGTFKDKDVENAKIRLKAQILMNAESKDNLVEDMAVQTHALGSHVSTADVCGKVDQVTSAQVSRAAKKIFGGKKSLAAIGELYNFPYLQDL